MSLENGSHRSTAHNVPALHRKARWTLLQLDFSPLPCMIGPSICIVSRLVMSLSEKEGLFSVTHNCEAEKGDFKNQFCDPHEADQIGYSAVLCLLGWTQRVKSIMAMIIVD